MSKPARNLPVTQLTEASLQAVADGHWPVLVLSLKDSHARRAKISKQLLDLQIPFTFFDAIDGRSGLPASLEILIDRDAAIAEFGRKMVDAEFACALSHLAIYKLVLDQGHRGVIVFEDDAILGSDVQTYYQSRAYEKADMIQLDHMDADIWKFSHTRPLIEGVKICPAARNASLATGYSLSRKASRFIFENAFPVRRPADWPCDVTSLPPMLAIPRIVDHPSWEVAQSAIEDARSAVNSDRTKDQQSRILRFLQKKYWQRWWFKRRVRRIS